MVLRHLRGDQVSIFAWIPAAISLGLVRSTARFLLRATRSGILRLANRRCRFLSTRMIARRTQLARAESFWGWAYRGIVGMKDRPRMPWCGIARRVRKQR